MRAHALRSKFVLTVILASITIICMTFALWDTKTIRIIYEKQVNVFEKRNEEINPEISNELFADFSIAANSHGRWRRLRAPQVDNMSRLGRILFLDEERPPARNRSFKILVWKYGPSSHALRVQQFSGHDLDPFAECAVKNCELTYKDEDAATAVIIHLHRTTGVTDVPNVRQPHQVWAYLTDESPFHTFMMYPSGSMSEFNGMFNWSMHYRIDADIPVPYGRTLLKKQINDDFRFDFDSWLASKASNVSVAIMGSNCGSRNHRWGYVKELQKWIAVDVYGGCGTLKCPGHFTADCPALDRYAFYLSFENSNCDGYITEKVWWNAYAKYSVPILMGAGASNYAQFLPPYSYIDVNDFATPRDLATYLAYLLRTPAELGRFHQWRKYFEVVNEHGYFKTGNHHYCRACEALNYNEDALKTYNDLKNDWDVGRDCTPAWDEAQPS